MPKQSFLPNSGHKVVNTLIILLIAVIVAEGLFLARALFHNHEDSYTQACRSIKGKDFKGAHRRLKEAADKGHAKAQTLLGMLYENGVGVEKDTEKAISYYRKAANSGLPEAESRLGHLLLNTEKESEVVSLETATWLKKAARDGQIEAQVTLGKLALDVKNSPINQNEAVWYLKDAAKKGNDQAKSMLGKLPKPPSSALGDPAHQVSAGVQGLQRSWKGYSDLANSINQAADYRR